MLILDINLAKLQTQNIIPPFTYCLWTLCIMTSSGARRILVLAVTAGKFKTILEAVQANEDPRGPGQI
jgi:hypothetical protein